MGGWEALGVVVGWVVRGLGRWRMRRERERKEKRENERTSEKNWRTENWGAERRWNGKQNKPPTHPSIYAHDFYM